MNSAIGERYFELGAGCAVHPGRSDEDRAWVGRTKHGSIAGVVCDGVGSIPDSGNAASIVVDAFASSIYGGARAVDAVRSAIEGLQHSETAGATTALSIEVIPGTMSFNAIGNGSVVESCFLPACSPGSTGRMLFWSDHFVPNIDYSGGRETLTSVISSSGRPPEWVDGRLSSQRACWTIWLLCTDGVSTLEERRDGTDGSGARWSEVPAPLTALLGELGQMLDRVNTGVEERTLDAAVQETLEQTLSDLDAGGDLHDDAAVVAVVVPPTVPTPADPATRRTRRHGLAPPPLPAGLGRGVS